MVAAGRAWLHHSDSRDEAEAIVRDANRVPRDPPNEVMVLAPFLHQLDVDYPT
jgi:hypothetical protein